VGVTGKYSIVFLAQLCSHDWILGNVAEDVLVESGRIARTKKGEKEEGGATVRTMDDTSAARNMVATVSRC
jgi:hypothetical protein